MGGAGVQSEGPAGEGGGRPSWGRGGGAVHSPRVSPGGSRSADTPPQPPRPPQAQGPTGHDPVAGQSRPRPFAPRRPPSVPRRPLPHPLPLCPLPSPRPLRVCPAAAVLPRPPCVGAPLPLFPRTRRPRVRAAGAAPRAVGLVTAPVAPPFVAATPRARGA